MLMLGYAEIQVFRRDTHNRMFHVKHPQGECSAHTCMGIAEPQDVGHEVSKQY